MTRTDRQTDEQTDRQTDRQTDTHTHKHTQRYTHTCTQPNTEREIQREKLTLTQTDTVSHRQTNKDREHTILKAQQTHKHTRTQSAYALISRPRWQTPKSLVRNGILGRPLTSIERTHRHISTANPAPQVCTNTPNQTTNLKHPTGDVKVA